MSDTEEKPAKVFKIALSPSCDPTAVDGVKFEGYLHDNGDPNWQSINLGPLEGNVYIFIDGVEWGSLYFTAKHGVPQISLGQYDLVKQEWLDRMPLIRPAGAPNPDLPIKVKLGNQIYAEFRTWSQAGKWVDTEDAEDWEIVAEPSAEWPETIPAGK